MIHINRVMIAGAGSGQGKTTVTMGLMRALTARGVEVSSFKCGPDYIDPMFHAEATGRPGGTLDSFFCGKEELCSLLAENHREVSVMEGVMAYYDGAGTMGSSQEISLMTETPVIIVLDCKGMHQSIGAVMKGFLEYRENRIRGFIFNRLPASLEDSVKRMCEELHTGYFGRLPYQKDIALESRHLGLVTAEEVETLQQKMNKLSVLCEECLEVDAILALAGEAPDLPEPCSEFLYPQTPVETNIKVALAHDRAFSFFYPDNIDFLKRHGIEPVYFSPVRDKKLPDNIQGLILPGGYPELYARALSENQEMKQEIRRVFLQIPVLAECGGFMYLHDAIETEGQSYPMVGLLPGKVINRHRLVRFGYVTMKPVSGIPFGCEAPEIKAHEYHYFDSETGGEDLEVCKVSRPKAERHGYAGPLLYAGFPHIYFYGNPSFGEAFVKACRESEAR